MNEDLILGNQLITVVKCMQIPCVATILALFPFTRLISTFSHLQNISKVDVGSLSLSSHTSIGRLDSVGRTILLVSDLVLPPHLGNQYEPEFDGMNDLRRTRADHDRWS